MSLDKLSDHVDDDVPVATAFNVGQGDSYLISMPAGMDSKGYMTHGFMLMMPAIAARRKVWWPVVGAVTPLRVLALTHRDADHVGEAVTVVEQFKTQPTKLTAKSYF
jgi:beta-lactamase superfamily II metal-dependent hydrolase